MGGAEPLAELPEALQLFAEERVAAFVGGREVSPQPGQLQALVGGNRGAELGDHFGVALAEPAHAGVVLDVDSRPNAQRSRSLGDVCAKALAPDRDLGAGAEGELELLGRERTHGEDGDVGQRRAQSLGLGRGGHRENRGPARERRAGAGHGTVTVAVGLDDGAQLRAAGQLARQAGAVAFHRAQVDRGDGPLQGTSPRGRAWITSLAITESADPIRSAARRPARAFA